VQIFSSQIRKILKRDYYSIDTGQILHSERLGTLFGWPNMHTTSPKLIMVIQPIATKFGTVTHIAPLNCNSS